MLKKQSLDTWLNEVDYSHLNSGDYIPSEFALMFMNFIKLVNGKEEESHKTPPVHLAMLDKIASSSKLLANLVFRGGSKTTLFMEYLALFIGMYGDIPGFGDISGMIYVSDSMENGVKSARNNIESRYYKSEFLQYWIPRVKFTDPYLEFENREGHKLGIRMFGAKTGLRGTKIFGKRPTLAVLDDLVSDDDSKSPAAMISIKDTVYKGVNYALDPVNRKTIFNGTPFNMNDVLIEAIESGAWDVNVWPVCETFPCSKEDFKGAWEDRFPYEFVKEQYENAVLTNKIAGFDQELMLRISSAEDRLVQDGEIKWYSREKLLQNSSNFNFYITTDLATSKKQTADFSVISVWAYNSNGDTFWVDGICERQTIDKTWNDLFRLAQVYKPQSVGIEVSGQQQAYITWLQEQMIVRNIWFNFASSEKSGIPGIRPLTDKLSRFNVVVPWFKAGKMYFPQELKTSVIMGQCMEQIRLTTGSGIKGKDDFLDTISMLGYLNMWKPSESLPITPQQEEIWEHRVSSESTNSIDSYIV